MTASNFSSCIYKNRLQEGVSVYTDMYMEIEFDPAKDAANIEKHGLSLARTAELDIIANIETTRDEDGERRFRLYGLIDGEAHCAVVTYRNETVRAISLRKANRMERKRYGLTQ